MKSKKTDFEDICKKFVEYLKTKQLKLTNQRMDVLARFLETRHHVNADELYQELRILYPNLGHSTVYRTLKLLTECEIAREVSFHDGTARYEPAINQEHHDHLVCLSCSRVVEFINEEVETIQEKIAKERGFVIRDHKFEIYGICETCQKKMENL